MAIRIRTSRPLLVLGSLALCVGSASAVPVHRAVVSRVSPVYPELARRMHVSGKVVLLVSVEPNGNVESTKVESGHPLLAPAAQEAVKHWRFAPDTTASETVIDVDFDMNGQ
ncbi:MAG: energy transducer TonB [Solirubrobacteraceae bacterium]